MYKSLDTVQISLHFLVNLERWNGCILFSVGLVNTKLKDSVNLSFLFLTFGSHVIYPIINVLVLSPTRFEIRQLSK